MEGKKVSESKIELAQLMLPPDANLYGNVHGGTIMKLIDNAAAIAAFRHSRHNCVTASVDRINFIAPIFIGNVVFIKASINRTWHTSIEVGARVDTEDLRTGKKTHCASAFLTYVAIDQDGKPVEVPPIIPETEIEQRRYEEALKRRETRINAGYKPKKRM